MDESNVVDLLPLIAECVLRRAAEMRVYADRIERAPNPRHPQSRGRRQTRYLNRTRAVG